MKASQLGLLGFKFAVTAILLWLLSSKINLDPVFSHLFAIRPVWAAAAVAVLMAQLLLTGLRWRLVGRLVSAEMTGSQALRLTMVGQFFNQVLPSSMGGDAVRAWLAYRDGVPFRRAVVSVVCDRATGLLVLTAIVSVTLSLFFVYGGVEIPSSRVFLIILPAIMVGGLLTLLLRGMEIAENLMKYRISSPLGVLIRDLHLVLFTSARSVAILTLAATIQTMLVLVVYFCARGINVDLVVGPGFLLIPTILLVSTMPISIGGWGVREGAMVIGLGFAGIPAEEALAISVAFGFAQIIIGLPGAVIWLIMRSKVRGRERFQ